MRGCDKRFVPNIELMNIELIEFNRVHLNRDYSLFVYSDILLVLSEITSHLFYNSLR